MLANSVPVNLGLITDNVTQQAVYRHGKTDLANFSSRND